MTENLAGRGEGLAGRITELHREATVGEHVHTTESEGMDYCTICWSRGRARQKLLELTPEILAALEAAAPPSTAPRQVTSDCIDQLREMLDRKDLSGADLYALNEAITALATPPPQAPPDNQEGAGWCELASSGGNGGCVYAAATQEQSSATAPGKRAVAMARIDASLPETWYCRAVDGLARKKLSRKAAKQLRECADELQRAMAASEFGPGDYSCATCGLGMVEPCEHCKASAASHGETEEDAGRQPEVCQSSSVEMTVKRWFCERCGVEHSIEMPACAATQEQPAGTGATPSWTQIIEEGLAALGSPRKVGEDAPEQRAVDAILHGVPEISNDIKRSTVESVIRAAFRGGAASVQIAVRPSSVPVGEPRGYTALDGRPPIDEHGHEEL